jgi:hypothetical protein
MLEQEGAGSVNSFLYSTKMLLPPICMLSIGYQWRFLLNLFISAPSQTEIIIFNQACSILVYINEYSYLQT